jgi:hypothetical protein
MNELTTINSATATAMAADMKVGLLATVDAHNLLHVTLITTIQACDPYPLSGASSPRGTANGTSMPTPRRRFS